MKNRSRLKTDRGCKSREEIRARDKLHCDDPELFRKVEILEDLRREFRREYTNEVHPARDQFQPVERLKQTNRK